MLSIESCCDGQKSKHCKFSGFFCCKSFLLLCFIDSNNHGEFYEVFIFIHVVKIGSNYFYFIIINFQLTVDHFNGKYFYFQFNFAKRKNINCAHLVKPHHHFWPTITISISLKVNFYCLYIYLFFLHIWAHWLISNTRQWSIDK